MLDDLNVPAPTGPVNRIVKEWLTLKEAPVLPYPIELRDGAREALRAHLDVGLTMAGKLILRRAEERGDGAKTHLGPSCR